MQVQITNDQEYSNAYTECLLLMIGLLLYYFIHEFLFEHQFGKRSFLILDSANHVH